MVGVVAAAGPPPSGAGATALEPAALGLARALPVVVLHRRALAGEWRQGQVQIRAARQPDHRSVVGIGVRDSVAVPQEDADASIFHPHDERAEPEGHGSGLGAAAAGSAVRNLPGRRRRQ